MIRRAFPYGSCGTEPKLAEELLAGFVTVPAEVGMV
jgi:hypothetical protein